jgi:small nuclear ribonucleoprotein (snRNP)-like protein
MDHRCRAADCDRRRLAILRFQLCIGGAYMSFPRRHHFKRRNKGRSGRHPERASGSLDARNLMQPDQTGSEVAYLRSLIDSRATVTVVLKSGERLHGHIRYYDRYCFSIGLSSKETKIFIRKASVAYIAEDQDLSSVP